MRTSFQTRKINEKNETSSNQELIQSMFFFKEIEPSRNLNFSSNNKIDLTIIFQTREINEKNETSSNQELIQSVFLFRQIERSRNLNFSSRGSNFIDRFLFER